MQYKPLVVAVALAVSLMASNSLAATSAGASASASASDQLELTLRALPGVIESISTNVTAVLQQDISVNQSINNVVISLTPAARGLGKLIGQVTGDVNRASKNTEKLLGSIGSLTKQLTSIGGGDLNQVTSQVSKIVTSALTTASSEVTDLSNQAGSTLSDAGPILENAVDNISAGLQGGLQLSG